MEDNRWNNLIKKHAPRVFNTYTTVESVLSVQHTYSMDCYPHSNLVHQETYDLIFTYWNKMRFEYSKVLARGNSQEEALLDLERKFTAKKPQKFIH